jgi:hypothetical protein
VFFSRDPKKTVISWD